MYNCQEITHVDLFTEQLVRKLILNRELETNYMREKNYSSTSDWSRSSFDALKA